MPVAKRNLNEPPISKPALSNASAAREWTRTIGKEMIYLAAIALLVLSHVIYRRGKNGGRVSIGLEKITVLLAAVGSLAAIVELGSFVTSLFVREGDDFSGWLPGIFVYPLGLILFLFVVFVLLPKPIPRTKQTVAD